MRRPAQYLEPEGRCNLQDRSRSGNQGKCWCTGPPCDRVSPCTGIKQHGHVSGCCCRSNVGVKDFRLVQSDEMRALCRVSAPHPHLCSGSRCPACHRGRVHTLDPRVSPHTSPRGGRGWGRRRKRRVDVLPFLNSGMSECDGWMRWAAFCPDVFNLSSCSLSSSGQNKTLVNWFLHNPVLSMKGLANSPQASHSITVFFRNTISLTCKVQQTKVNNRLIVIKTTHDS